MPVLVKIVPTLSLWKAYVDELSNSRGSTVRVVIFIPTGGYNVVWYESLLLALHQLMSLEAKRVLVHSDL